MKRKKSYQELLEEYAMTQKKNETNVSEWYAEIILNDLLAQHREKQLRVSIDQALDRRDKEAFDRLTEELKVLVGH